MKRQIHLLIFTILFSLGNENYIFSQGNTCATAVSLGTLPTPAGCGGAGGGLGAAVTQNGTNVGATAGNPYTYIADCGTGTADMVTNALDVWYSFVASGTSVNINITNITGSLGTPNIGLYSGSCNALGGVGCDIDGSPATFNGLQPGQTYYIQISGSTPTGAGNFTISVSNDFECGNCLQTSALTASPMPVNGFYSPGQTVTFCYQIFSYTQVNTNWLHGIQVNWGSGWNFVSATPPPGCSTGNWVWMPTGIGNVNGTNWGPGFYFESNLGCNNCNTSNPGDNFGDNNAQNCDPTFCFTLQVDAACPASSLNVTVNTSGDGESGSWSNLSCQSDNSTTFDPLMTCCTAPTVSTVNSTCTNTSDGSATATVSGTASPWDYYWYDANGNLITSVMNVGNSNTLNNLLPGDYSVVVIDNSNCSSGQLFTIASNPGPTVTVPTNITVCSGQTVSASNFTSSGSPNASFTWTNSNSSIGIPSSGTGNVPTFTATNTGTTPITATVLVTPYSGPNPATSCAGANSSYTITVNPAPQTSLTPVPSPTICPGQTVTLTGNYTPVPQVTNVPFTNGNTINIPNGNGNAGSTSVTSSGILPANFIAGQLVSICFSIRHEDFTEFTVLRLQVGATIYTSANPAPAGQIYSVDLFNLLNQIKATPPGVGNPTPPVTINACVPQGLLTIIENSGTSTNNTWTISIIDGTNGPDNGIFLNFEVIIKDYQINSFNWSSPSGTLSSGTATSGSLPISVSPTITITYTFSITDESGCTGTGNITVNVGGSTPTVFNQLGPYCINSTPGTLPTTSPSGITGTWSPATIITSTAGTNVYNFTPAANQCAAVATMSITVNGLPDANAGTAQTISCATSTVSLNGSSTSSPVNYSWSGPGILSGNNTASAVVNATGTYTLTVTNTTTGCSNTSTVSVSASAGLPNISMGNSQVIDCINLSATISGTSTTPGVNYQWSAGANTPNNPSTSVNTAGTYTLTVTDPSNGCSNYGTVLVTNNSAQPNADAGSNQFITCSTNSVSLSGSSTTLGVNFLWTPGGSTPSTSSTNVNAAGTYTLTVTDPSNGCSAQSTVIVALDTASPDVNAGNIQTLTCGQNSVTISGSSATAGTSFSWEGPSAGSPAGTTPTSSSTQVSAVGVYTLSVTNPSNGCSASDTVSVLPDANLPNVSAGNDAIISCNNTSANLVGGSTTSGVSFSWSGPAGFSSSSSSVNVSGTGTYTLVVTNPLNNCSSTDLVDVIDSTQAPNVNAGTDITLTCLVTSASISGSSSTTPVAYSWSGPSGFNSSNANNSVTTVGDYTLTVTNLSTGCSSSDIVSILDGTNVPNVNPGTSQTINCINTSVNLNGSSTTANAQFNWTGPGGFNSNVSNPSVSADGLYTLTVTDPNTGCTNNASVTVLIDTITPDVNVAVSEDTLNCIVTSSLLTGSSNTPGVIMLWNLTSNNPVTVNAPGTYALAVSNPVNGCSIAQTISIYQDIVPPSVTPFASDDTLNCANPEVSLGATGSNGYSYSWSGPNSFSSSQQNPSNQVNTAGTYSLSATNPQNGCISNLTINIYQGVDPIVGFTSNPTSGVAPLIVQFTNTSTSGFSGYQWSFGDNSANSNQVNPSNIYNQPGTYTVQLVGLTANNNCNDTTFATIVVFPEASILIPNIFSPNGDGTNEFFFITSTGLKELQVDIYDRWGLKVGEINGPNGYWDGTNSSEGTYFYILNATGFD
ncbi:MAG: gliding motility-associated C-terminal domain-containing protein, partial [Bacteroidota bacterium]